MPSLFELEKQAQQKGITSKQRNLKDTGANNIVENYVVGYSAEGALKNSIDSLDGFCSYWDEQAVQRSQLSSPSEYLDQVNTIFSSYRTIRKNLDGTISYLIGDWLLDCRNRFFPGEDRKTRGTWSKFLTQNLCKDFERTTAYEFMAIAEKLKQYRQNRLPLHTLKALLRARNNGVDIAALDVNKISSKEILALRKGNSDTSSTVNSSITKLRLLSDLVVRELKVCEASDVNQAEIARLKISIHDLNEALKLFPSQFQSAPRTEILEQG